MRLLFIGDIIGRAGRAVLLSTLPELRRRWSLDWVGADGENSGERGGGAVLLSTLPELRRRWSLDCVVVNGENSAGGFGITETICTEFLEAGADCITLGNHSFDQREALVFITRQPRLIRPMNYPKGTPGGGTALIDTERGHRVPVASAMGRTFMNAMDDPFAAIDAELEACPLGQVCDAAIIDFHAEATSEKQ